MSASFKPPRPKRPQPTRTRAPPTPDRVARALCDAEVFGDKRAAAKAGIHHRTIEEWRKRYVDDAAVLAAKDRVRAELAAGWIDEARSARRSLIDRVVVLASTSKKLGEVTNALRRVNEVVMAHEIIEGGDVEPPEPEPDDAERDDADQPAPPREAEGED